MKRLFCLLIALALLNQVFAQTPDQFKYQAVLRDASGNVIAAQAKAVVIDILQGSTTGAVVFTETHNVTTTAQGIINLYIGSVNKPGIAAINWGADTYFIKITVGGVEMGTSQLLSVPYSIYAKKAENFTGTISKNQITDLPDYSPASHTHTDASVSVSGFMSTADKTKLNGLNNLTAGTGITINGSNQIINSSPDRTVTISGQNGITVTGTYPDFAVSGTTSHTIGESFGGGIVFYVTPNGQHGLIAETQDQSTSCNWFDAPDAISNPSNHSTAGRNYTDWRLPSYTELAILFSQKAVVGGFASANYWRSRENSDNTTWAWTVDFATIAGVNAAKSKFDLLHVRGIRSF